MTRGIATYEALEKLARDFIFYARVGFPEGFLEGVKNALQIAPSRPRLHFFSLLRHAVERGELEEEKLKLLLPGEPEEKEV